MDIQLKNIEDYKITELRSICETLKISKAGTKTQIYNNISKFLKIENTKHIQHEETENIKLKNNSKLTNENVKEIRNIWNTDFSIQLKHLTEKYKISSKCLRNVLSNKSYYDSEYVPLENRPKYNLSKRKLNDLDIIEIKNLYKTNNYTQEQLAKQFNVKRPTISAIILERYRKDTK
jgi:DNA-binding XRE family transcriptional regulator